MSANESGERNTRQQANTEAPCAGNANQAPNDIQEKFSQIAQVANQTAHTVTQTGIGLGSAIAVVCAWQRNRSILRAILAGVFFAFGTQLTTTHASVSTMPIRGDVIVCRTNATQSSALENRAGIPAASGGSELLQCSRLNRPARILSRWPPSQRHFNERDPRGMGRIFPSTPGAYYEWHQAFRIGGTYVLLIEVGVSAGQRWRPVIAVSQRPAIGWAQLDVKEQAQAPRQNGLSPAPAASQGCLQP